jgi:hypothetical protein
VRALLVSKWTKVAVFFLCLAPFAGLVRRTLGRNIEDGRLLNKSPRTGSGGVEEKCKP